MDVRSEYGSSYINDVVLMMDFDDVFLCANEMVFHC